MHPVAIQPATQVRCNPQISPCLLRTPMHARLASRAGAQAAGRVQGGMAHAVRARMHILARMAAELRKQAEENFGGSIRSYSFNMLLPHR
ncbi:hypothetical protein PMIN01_13189 [Paraphaeosphaeria minitans]|uniref:Uncharacterized protein n=1 Tax=Paraphaeosphaeria minitans TaxID=565426 RepID=A0A9P6G6T7_9PLEO|nr:hypothetical protein PMIN01_13189 [Paraphaeosphaeria minitans]